MAGARLIKTSFAAGELDPRLFGRLDLKAQEDGASKLRNVVVQATGGVSRRPGLAFVATIPGAVRLVPMDGSDGGELLAFGEFRVDVVADGAVVAGLGTPWSAAALSRLAWARLGDKLLLTHPDVAPQVLTRTSRTSWSLAAWRFDSPDDGTTYPPLRQPYARFVADDVTLQAVLAGSPSTSPVPAGSSVTLQATAPVFTAQHIGTLFRLRGKEVQVSSVQSATQAVGLVRQAMADGKATRSWDEQAFSPARGFPASLGFHQNRLVIGGSRDLPDRIWLSRTDRPFDFDLGTGLDDEAIAFRLASERLQAIVNVHAGRQLQVFTGAGEWVVKGFPLTPGSIQLERQTGVGSLATRRLPPVDVDGATLFVGPAGRDLREFLYADTEQAYQAADLALLARHLMLDPVDLAFDQNRRLLVVVRGDGAAALVTLDRNSNVVAWSVLTTAGAVKAVALWQGELHLLVDRNGTMLLERFEDGLGADAGRILTSPSLRTSWAGLGHLNGRSVTGLADQIVVGPLTVSGSSVTTPVAARRLAVGLPFEHEIEALPLMAAAGRELAPDLPYRAVRITFRLLETTTLTVDAGSGPRAVAVPLVPGGFTGDVTTRAIGWRRGAISAPWRIVQSQPLPCTLLSVTTEIRGND
ncbi:MAG: hypothetical protein U1E14_05565 [Geminicoccaceae bacterium]